MLGCAPHYWCNVRAALIRIQNKNLVIMTNDRLMCILEKRNIVVESWWMIPNEIEQLDVFCMTSPNNLDNIIIQKLHNFTNIIQIEL